MNLDSAVAHRLHHRELSETYASEGADSGVDFQIDFVAGIEETEIDVGALEHEPENAVPMSAKMEEQNHALIRQRIDAHHSAQRPHQEIGIEILVRQILARPAVAPGAERIDHRAELATAGGEMVFLMSILAGSLLDDAAALEGVQALGEKIPRDPWNAAVDVGESSPAHEQLAQNERGPALGEDLGAECHGTELSVGGHDSNVDGVLEGGKSNF